MFRRMLVFVSLLGFASTLPAQDEPAPPSNPPRQNAGQPQRNERDTNDSLARSNRLKRLPRMYGDSLQSTQFGFVESIPDVSSTGGFVQVPSLNTARIADNNSPMPQHRVFFTYQHFHNAIDSGRFDTSGDTIATRSLDLYTVGVEKTFLDDLCSVEFRLPFSSSIAIAGDDARFNYDSLQSITSILKVLLWSDDDSVLSIGLGISFPVVSESASISMDGVNGRLAGQSPRFAPFIGFGHLFSESTFMSSFIQFSIPSSREFVELSDGIIKTRDSFDPNSLMMLSISGGRWLMSPSRGRDFGLAAMLELHYTTAFGDDQSAFVSLEDTLLFQSYDVFFGRFDTLNLTSGFHVAFRQTNFRLAVVSPLREDRFFDTEIHFSINREF